MKFIYKLSFLLFVPVLFSPSLFAQGRYDGPRTIADLQIAIEKVLEETGTPAVGIALVNKDSTVWVAGLGTANLEKNTKANENTMFRIGSVSKMFVSLAILKLHQEGLVDLNDKVRDLVPDVKFENSWEKTAPIRVAHLLEHTTGWDDMHLGDYAIDKPKMTLKEGLDFLPASRTSRWVPGTRMAYCNSGPAVAAYIVEKITGQKFEEYIRKNFFVPMNMENMTFFQTDTYKKLGATLYLDKKPQKYWNITVRPSGAINASPKDMAKMLRFFVNRGKVDSLSVISETSLKRMETTLTTTGGKAGLEYGYGLSNYATPYKSYVYRTHGGGVNGGLTDFSYLPNHQLGYAVMINSGDGNALNRITDLIREFQTKRLMPDKIFRRREKVKAVDVSGYYVSVNPRIAMTYFIDRIFDVRKVKSFDGVVFINGLFGGWSETHRAINERQYIAEETGKINLVTANDPMAGQVLHNGGQVLARVSPFLVYGQILLFGLWILYMAAALTYGIVWFVRFCRGRTLKEKTVLRWPLFASLFVLLTFILGNFGGKDPFELLGKISLISVSMMITTIGFALATFVSVIMIIKEHKADLKRNAYWHMAILSGLNLIAACYLAWYGVIGIQTWK